MGLTKLQVDFQFCQIDRESYERGLGRFQQRQVADRAEVDYILQTVMSTAD